ncbi:MAG TPA: DNA polymerase IV [Gaiellales bacterium]|nr:DNA polymerase IV [Gaiellales bacterium]
MIAHLDLDAFFAAVELHRNPDLRGKPVVVGGSPDGRGVVATASYEARRFGIRSAMSSAEARRRCPGVIFVRPDHGAYREWSRRVWSLVREMAPVVEQVGIDEGYLVLPDGDPREQAELIQLAVRERMRLSCSLGVATCKVVAKVASDARKPGGITVVPPGGEAAFLARLPVRTLPGVGPKAEVRLVAAGISTIGGLAELDDARLAELLPGRVGGELRLRAQGVDPRPVSGEPAEAISISNEETFDTDVRDRDELYGYLRRMSEGLAAALERRGMSARTVTTKVRYPDFAIATRSHSLPVGIDDAASIADLACSLLDRALRSRPGPIRLVGVGVSGLDRHRQLSLPVEEDATP